MLNQVEVAVMVTGRQVATNIVHGLLGEVHVNFALDEEASLVEASPSTAALVA